MIELIHRHPILIKLLLTLVTVTFVGTGGWMWMANKEDQADFAAKVNGERITVREYEDALQRMQEFYNKTFQGKLPPDFIKKLDINKRALDSLVDRKLVLMAAKDEGVTVSDEEVARSVTENNTFHDENGKFSKDRYITLLKNNGFTPSSFEASLKEDMVAEKFRKMIKDAVYVTDNDLKDYYARQLKSQNKAFDETEFKAKHDELARTVTGDLQEETLKSFMEGLKKRYNVERNEAVLAARS